MKKLAKLIKFFKKLHVKKLYLISFVLITIPLIIEAGSFTLNEKNKKPNNYDEVFAAPTMTPKSTPSDTPTNLSESQIISQTPTPITAKAPTTTPTPTIMPTNTPIPAPTRTPNPPQVHMIFPLDGQVVNQDGGSFCVADGPSGGDTSGIQRKKNINNGGWSNYEPISTLCYEPSEGQNVLMMQYKNQYGEESQVYTTNFTFHRKSPTLSPTPTP